MNRVGKEYRYNVSRIQKIQDFADITLQDDEVIFAQMAYQLQNG